MKRVLVWLVAFAGPVVVGFFALFVVLSPGFTQNSRKKRKRAEDRAQSSQDSAWFAAQSRQQKDSARKAAGLAPNPGPSPSGEQPRPGGGLRWGPGPARPTPVPF